MCKDDAKMGGGLANSAADSDAYGTTCCGGKRCVFVYIIVHPYIHLMRKKHRYGIESYCMMSHGI